MGWLAADPYMNGKLVEQAPRNVLKRVVADAAAKGYTLKTGVECEFFLISPDGTTISDAGDHQSKPCYDQQALMRRYDVISEKIRDSCWSSAGTRIRTTTRTRTGSSR